MPDLLSPHMLIYFAGLLTGAVIDYRTGRLPNWLTFSMMALGLAIWASWGAPMVALKGIAVAFGIHFALFALNVVRAGDAKLVMGAAALVGWQEAIDLTAWYAAIYIPVGFAMLAYKGRLRNLLTVAQKKAVSAQTGVAGDEPENLTYLRTGPVIAAAGVAAALTDVLNFA